MSTFWYQTAPDIWTVLLVHVQHLSIFSRLSFCLINTHHFCFFTLIIIPDFCVTLFKLSMSCCCRFRLLATTALLSAYLMLLASLPLTDILVGGILLSRSYAMLHVNSSLGSHFIKTLSVLYTCEIFCLPHVYFVPLRMTKLEFFSALSLQWGMFTWGYV